MPGQLEPEKIYETDLCVLEVLPEELEIDEAGLVVCVLEAGLAAGDDVELVVGQLQGPVDPHGDRNAPLLSLLQVNKGY